MGYGKADSRLTEESSGGRGCGGVEVLWHKLFGATVVSGISSDRICAICLRIDDGDRSQLTVIGVYLPCSDKGMDTYQDHLVELERVISDSSVLGAVIILGDFNAHLGQLGGIRDKCARRTAE